MHDDILDALRYTRERIVSDLQQSKPYIPDGSPSDFESGLHVNYNELSKYIPINVLFAFHRMSRQGECYIVGGAALNVAARIYQMLHYAPGDPNDWDMFTSVHPQRIMELFPDAVPISGQDGRVYTVTLPKHDIEISTFRKDGKRDTFGENVIEHLNTCDFTINAIAMTPHGLLISQQTLDDMKEKRLRCVGDANDRINEDSNRVVRAIRFASRYNMTLDDDLRRILTQYDISQIPKENIQKELMKSITYPRSIELLMETGMLGKIFPKMGVMESMTAGKNHLENLLDHSIMVYVHGVTLQPTPLFALTCLLHDYGKVDTMTEEGKAYGHDKLGADQVTELMKDLSFSNDDVAYVTTLIRYHMAGYVEELRTGTWLKIFDTFQKNGVPVEDLVKLQYADHKGRITPNAEETPEYESYRDQNQCWIAYKKSQERKLPVSTNDLDINGHDIMALGIPAGPRVRDVLEQLHALVANEVIQNKKEELLMAATEIIQS